MSAHAAASFEERGSRFDDRLLLGYKSDVRLRAYLVVAAVSMQFVACAESAGTIDLIVSWDPVPPPFDHPVYLRGALDAADRDGAFPRAIETRRFDQNLQVSLLEIPNGVERTLTLEVIDGPFRNSRVLYMGRSPPFELAAGLASEVEVVLRPVDDLGERGGPPSLVADDLEVVHAPWGAELLATVDGTIVRGRVESAASGLRVLLFDRENVASARELKRDTLDSEGGFSVGIVENDIAVFVAVLDEENNLSDSNVDVPGHQATSVERVSTVVRPHVDAPMAVHGVPNVDGTLRQTARTLRAFRGEDLGRMARVDGDAIEEASEAVLIEVPRTVAPSARSGHLLSANPRDGEVVLFGGNDADEVSAETWAFERGTWRIVTPAVPEARAVAALAYDNLRGEHVLYGGSSAGDVLGSAWRLTGGVWSPIPAPPIGTVPSFRNMAYHAEAGVSVLFARGTDPNDRQTWLWDGVTWIPRNEAPQPPSLAGGGMAYDPNRKTIVLWGDVDGPPPPEIWEWDVHGWRLRGVGGPDRRIGPVMVYDETRELMLLHGGRGAIFFDDLWAWNGSTWREVGQPLPPWPRPTGVLSHGAAFDRILGGVMLFGGKQRANEPLDQHYLWAGEAWTLPSNAIDMAPSPNQPAPTADAAFAYDAFERQVVLVDAEGNTFVRQGARWERPTAPQPPLPARAAMAFDGRFAVMRLYGGLIGAETSTATFWRNEETWTVTASVATTPGERLDASMVYDAAGRRLLLFGGVSGGEVQSDLWTFDGIAWTEVETAQPPPARARHRMVYDAANERVLMFGGVGVDGRPLDDLWSLEGAEWTKVTSENGPGPREAPGLAYDRDRSVLVLFGGRAGADTFSDVWEHDGTQWLEVVTSTPAPQRSGHAMVYDLALKATVIFGGEDELGMARNDTWEMRSESRRQTSLLFELDSAALPIVIASDDLASIRIAAAVGGTRGLEDGGGATVSIWNHREARWKSLGAFEQEDATIGAIEVTVPTPAADFVGRDGKIHIRLNSHPGAATAATPRRVLVDAIEVRLDTLAGASATNSCGDGRLFGAERCDDGDIDDGDGCSSECAVERHFTCAGVRSVCAPCGDGRIDEGEACDDGELLNGAEAPLNGDGCNDLCQIER